MSSAPRAALAEIVVCANCLVIDYPTKTEFVIDWAVVNANKIELVCEGTEHVWGATVFGPGTGTTTETIDKTVAGDSALSCTGYSDGEEIDFPVG